MAHIACHCDSSLTEDTVFADDGHRVSPKHSPRRSPRGVVQTPAQQAHTGLGPQAGPSSPAPRALPQPALSPSMPSQLQPSPTAATQPSTHSASSAQPHLPTSAFPESLTQPHSASAIQPSVESPHQSPSPHSSAQSGLQDQPRPELSHSAESHQKARPALSVRTSSQSPAGQPNQEMLAGLGSALRAQARLRRKAVAPETASPDERDSSVTGHLGEVSPSGQLSFDDVELKSKGASCGQMYDLHSLHCILPI